MKTSRSASKPAPGINRRGVAIPVTVGNQKTPGRRKGPAMRLLGLVIGALILLVSAITFAAPDLRLSLERSVMTPAGLYAIAALRIAIGLVFVFAAPASRAPRTLRVFGQIVIIAGLLTPWFGVARAEAVLNWFTSAGPLLMRLDASVGMAIGGFLVYVLRTPTRRAT
jgi:hypothetical protein